ncbi:MAG: hypothetical protein ACD_43C00280G0001 [uncultured bacterium]|nr:MAG: hypothetical protein ACD_43C00280G0001 [uncultured bacterium]
MIQTFSDVIQHLRKELASLQVGRVSPAILDDVMVEAYGTRTALAQLAAITSQGAQLLIIQPWDASILKDVERALRTCGRDYNPLVDGTTVKLPFPPLTEEKRRSMVKLVSDKCEDTHVQIKRIREEMMQVIKNKKAAKELSEDAFFAEQKSIQKQVDDTNKAVDKIGQEKEADIMKI